LNQAEGKTNPYVKEYWDKKYAPMLAAKQYCISTIAEEKLYNVFFRVRVPDL